MSATICTSSPALCAAYVPMMASAATYCTWPEASSANALLRSSVVEKVALSNSFVTAQALFDDTCAAIFVSTTFVGTCVLDGAENNATAVGRYASDFQNEVLLSDLSMPMTMSTVPSLRADSASDPTLTTSSFSPNVDADDFGRGGRLSRQGLVVGVHTDAQRTVLADGRRGQRGRLLGGSVALLR